MQTPSTVRFPSPQVAATRIARQGPWAGRRPLHFVPGEYLEAPPVGRYFARLAECETASLSAFARFAAELEAHGAPTELAEEAREAAREVVHHAEIAHELALRFGTEPIFPLFASLPPRGIVLSAIDNAVEGCIRQTYGALVVTYQAKGAKDLPTRDGMRSVASEKRRHAALAWRASVWFEKRLPSNDVERIRRAQHEELEALGREVDPGLTPFERGLLGLPDRDRALSILERLTRELWSVADPRLAARATTHEETPTHWPRVLESEPPPPSSRAS